MRRAGILAVAAVAILAGQSIRDSYRNAYRAWRQADPNLERESGAGGPALASRIDSVAALASKYGAERGAFFRRMASDQKQSFAWLETPPQKLPDFSRGVQENVAAQTTLVKRNLQTFANDRDPGLQQLKLMLDRENTALSALSGAIQARQDAADAIKTADASAEQARLKGVRESHAIDAALSSAAELATREATAWTQYYRQFAEAAKVEAPKPVETPRPPKPVSPNARFVGAWTFPVGGLFHGPQPEFLELLLKEDNGRAIGTVSARFRLPPVSNDDPAVRFEFSGDFKNSRSQMFSIETNDGSKGTIELIPGPAYNLLEVNFLIDAKAGKIRQGNVVLIKK